MKIYKKSNQPGYLVLSDVKIRSFSHIWNSAQDKNINKAHLKKFLEEAFPRNFLFYFGSWLGFFLDEKCFTPFAYKYVVDVSSILEYFLEKGKEEGEIDIYYREDLYPYFDFTFDVSSIYKPFSHLISEENFSFLLRKQFYELAIHPAWHTENLINCTFFSSKKTLNNFLQGKEEWSPKDKEFWDKCFSKEVTRIEKNREKVANYEKTYKNSFIMSLREIQLDSYLYKKE